MRVGAPWASADSVHKVGGAADARHAPNHQRQRGAWAPPKGWHPTINRSRPSQPPGCTESTSRCQLAKAMDALAYEVPVLPVGPADPRCGHPRADADHAHSHRGSRQDHAHPTTHQEEKEGRRRGTRRGARVGPKTGGSEGGKVATQPPDQEEKEGRRRGTRRGARPATLCPCESASDQSVTPGEHPELDPRDEGNAQDSEDGCRPRHVLGFASRRYHRVNQRHANRRFGHSGVVQHRDRRHHPRSSNAMRVASQPQSTMYAPQTRHAGQDHRFTRSEAEQRRPRAGAHRRPGAPLF